MGDWDGEIDLQTGGGEEERGRKLKEMEGAGKEYGPETLIIGTTYALSKQTTQQREMAVDDGMLIMCKPGRRLRSEKRQLSSGPGFLEPAAYSSVLYKQAQSSALKKYVLTFQGTSLDDTSMLVYNLKKQPVWFSHEGGTPVIAPMGYVMYISKVIACLDGKLAGEDTSGWYITGHSLGGAAASLFKAATGFAGNLVTFGTPPLFLDYVPGKTELKGEYAVDGDYFKGANPMPGSPVSLPQTGVRYFHKFDPVPGYYFSSAGGLWNHATSVSYMLYDTLDEGCSGGNFDYDPTTYMMVDYDPSYVATNAVPDKYAKDVDLKSFLCSVYDVKPNNWKTTVTNYYSYSNALTYFPCQETIVSSVMQTLGKVAGWTPYESIGECASTYTATVKAYGKIFAASGLSSQWTDRKDSYYIMMYSLWGLFWIHSTYPNYPMAQTDFSEKSVPKFWDTSLPDLTKKD